MKKIKDNRRGSTLVEVIVTFALIGMFLLAATTAVSAAMNAFYRMESCLLYTSPSPRDA